MWHSLCQTQSCSAVAWSNAHVLTAQHAIILHLLCQQCNVVRLTNTTTSSSADALETHAWLQSIRPWPEVGLIWWRSCTLMLASIQLPSAWALASMYIGSARAEPHVARGTPCCLRHPRQGLVALPKSICHHPYEWSATIHQRAEQISSHRRGCPLCTGRTGCPCNSLAARCPEVAIAWHHIRNREDTAEQSPSSSGATRRRQHTATGENVHE